MAALGNHSEEKPAKTARRRDPEKKKRALVNATLDIIAENGITETTISSIIERAGLSRGMINLHFESKNNLLVASAKAFNEEYYDILDNRIQHAGGTPAQIILELVRADLSEALMNERSARIWHAFRGVASTNAGIARYSSPRDKRLRGIIRSAFEKIAAEYESPQDVTQPRDATFSLLALLEGMWVDYLSNPNAFSREDALSVIRHVLARLFPRHFQNADNH